MIWVSQSVHSSIIICIINILMPYCAIWELLSILYMLSIKPVIRCICIPGCVCCYCFETNYYPEHKIKSSFVGGARREWRPLIWMRATMFPTYSTSAERAACAPNPNVQLYLVCIAIIARWFNWICVRASSSRAALATQDTPNTYYVIYPLKAVISFKAPQPHSSAITAPI